MSVTTPISRKLNLDSWKAHSEVFSFRGHAIFAKDSHTENKPTLLLIHGFPTSSIDWQPLWPVLTEHFRCIALDLLGFGLSAKPLGQPITIMEQAQLCRALLQSKDIEEAHILCHDYGVSVGQELLAGAQMPSSFTPLSCIFLNGGLFPGVHRPRLIQKLLMSPIGFLVAKLTSYRRFSVTMREICTQPIREEELELFWALLIRDNGRKILPALIRYMSERKTHAVRWSKATEHPPCKTLLINGIDDPISGAHLADAYQTRVPNAKVVRLYQTGHYPQVESPEKVWQAASMFWHCENDS